MTLMKVKKFYDFKDLIRSEGQSINEYVTYFYSNYTKIEKKNIEFCFLNCYRKRTSQKRKSLDWNELLNKQSKTAIKKVS